MEARLKVAAVLIVSLLLSVHGCAPTLRTHDAAFSRAGLLTVDEAEQLPSIRIEGHQEAPINAGTNLPWCGTFQLAWNDVRSLIGEDIHLAGGPAMVDFKNRRFEHPFEQVGNPILFAGQRIACFGMGEEYKSEHELLCPQISILDYRTPDDFVIELKTKAKGDQIILAKTQPRQTLAMTLAEIQGRMNRSKPHEANLGDVLKVPRLNFDITRRYREIENLHLLVTNPQVGKDLALLSAVQNIRFQMDEEGVRLRSEAHLALGCSALRHPMAHHVMVFDKPFLILMRRTGASSPYFALWVGNPDILVRK